MTVQNFNALRMKAKDCETLKQYINACSDSIPPEWISGDGSTEKITYGLTLIWELSHSYDFPHLLKMSGLSSVGFSLEYDIPLQTVEDWRMNQNLPHQWTFDILARSVISWIVESAF